MFKVNYPKERRDMTEYLKQYIKLFGNDATPDVNVSDAPSYISLIILMQVILLICIIKIIWNFNVYQDSSYP